MEYGSAGKVSGNRCVPRNKAKGSGTFGRITDARGNSALSSRGTRPQIVAQTLSRWWQGVVFDTTREVRLAETRSEDVDSTDVVLQCAWNGPGTAVCMVRNNPWCLQWTAFAGDPLHLCCTYHSRLIDFSLITTRVNDHI